MKKLFAILFAGLLLASCSKDEVLVAPTEELENTPADSTVGNIVTVWDSTETQTQIVEF